jgi:hypothetical protein
MEVDCELKMSFTRDDEYEECSALLVACFSIGWVVLGREAAQHSNRKSPMSHKIISGHFLFLVTRQTLTHTSKRRDLKRRNGGS